MIPVLYVCVFSVLLVSTESLKYPRILYSAPVEYPPGYCSLLFNPIINQYDLAYSSFEPNLFVSKIIRIPSVSKNYLDKSKMVTQVVTDDFIWPRQNGVVPDGTFGNSFYWSSASGFFFKEAEDGSIAVINMTNPNNPGKPVVISSSEGEDKWFYSRVEWYDMDGDGDQDVITERARGNGTHATASELVWFENPGSIPPAKNWKFHVLSQGYEDNNFLLHKLPLPGGRKTLVIISGGFFSRALTITWSINNNWKRTSSLRHRIIDNSGWHMSLQIFDVNGDGEEDLLITTWSRPGPDNMGAVLVYEVPIRDWRIDTWPRHVLSTDFLQDMGPGKGSPGSPTAFWRSKTAENNGEKPHIVVNGDDDGKVFLLKPDSQNLTNWSYTQSTIYSTSGTVGTMAVGDVDNDGYTEFFIPAYDMKGIVVMTYRPS